MFRKIFINLTDTQALVITEVQLRQSSRGSQKVNLITFTRFLNIVSQGQSQLMVRHIEIYAQ